MPKNPMLVDQVIFKPDNTVDPSETGGLTYKSGTGFRMNVGGTVYTIPTSSSAGAGNVGTGLSIPYGTTAPDGTVAGSIYFETDAAKLWVYDGVGWKGVTVA